MKGVIDRKRLGNTQKRATEQAMRDDAQHERMVDIPVDQLEAAPWNARKWFDKEALNQLAAQLKMGQIEPIVVRQLDTKRYQVVAGERRYRAAKSGDLKTLKAIVRSLSDFEARRVSLSENLDREDLSVYEETTGYFDMLLLELTNHNASTLTQKEAPGLTESDLLTAREAFTAAQRKEEPPEETLKRELVELRKASKRKDAITSPLLPLVEMVFERNKRITWTTFAEHRLFLLDLPKPMLKELQEGNINYTHAKELVKIGDATWRERLLKAVAEEDLSLRALQQLGKVHSPKARQDLLKLALDPEVSAGEFNRQVKRALEGTPKRARSERRLRSIKRKLQLSTLEGLDKDTRKRVWNLVEELESLLAE